MKRSVLNLGLAALLVGFIMIGGAAWAFPSLTDLRSTCTEENCKAVKVRGTYVHYQSEGATKAIPAVYQIFSNGGECVRVEVIFQDTDLDLEATLVCPDGMTWQDDDSGDDLKPLIKAITDRVSGWCTLHLSSYDGDGVGGADFVGERNFIFRYGRYARRNPNCDDPTEPRIP